LKTNRISIAVGFIVCAFMFACSQHHVAGVIGPYEIHVIQSWHAVSPSSTETFVYDTREQDLSQVNQGVGGGVLSIAAAPIATVTAAHEIGKGLRSSGDTNTTTNTTSSTSEGSRAVAGSSAKGGEAMANGGESSSLSGAAAQASPAVNTHIGVAAGAVSGSQALSGAQSSSVATGGGDGWTPPGQAR
jgi:hypothetical protein